MPKTRITRYTPILLFLLVLGYAWYTLAIANGALLYTAQDFNPWLGTQGYWQQLVGHPGGLREWAGGWCTQLFYYPVLGATLLVACWGLTAGLLMSANRLSGYWASLVLIPIVALLASTTQLGYWIFCLKSPSYWFGPTLGLLMVALSQFIFSLLRCERYRLLFLFVWCLFSIPLLGWYGTLGLGVLLLCAPWRVTLKAWLSRLGMILLPLMVVGLWYHDSPSLHWHEPLLFYGFHHFVISEAATPLLEAPFWVMAITVLLLPLFTPIAKRFSKFGLMAIMLLAATVFGGNMLNYRNVNFHTELQMLRAMDEGRWDDVLRPMNHLKRQPTREMVLMADVALAQQGRLGDQAFCIDYRGTRPVMNIDLPIHMAHSASPNIYYWLGLPNYCFMWCQEDNIEYGLSPYFLRLMYRSAIANGELQTARKYRLLLNTLLFHSDYEVSPDETGNVRRFMTQHDEVTNDRGFCEIYLTERLSEEQYDSPVEQQLALHFAMLRRSRSCFAKALAHFIELSARKNKPSSTPIPEQVTSATAVPLPRYIQEAALLYGVAEGLNIDPAIAKRYETYRLQLDAAKQMTYDAESIGRQLWTQFGNTYWWYYDFYTFNKTY